MYNPLKAVLTAVAGFVAVFLLLQIASFLLKFPVPVILLCSLLPVLLLVPLFLPRKTKTVSGEQPVYRDRYIELYADRIVIKGYLLGYYGALDVPFRDIQKLEVIRLKYGNWKVQGSQDLKTWFAMDWKRRNNMENFALESPRCKYRLGFSVEDIEQVSAIFRDKGLMAPAPETQA